jgi:hypothetical protein
VTFDFVWFPLSTNEQNNESERWRASRCCSFARGGQESDAVVALQALVSSLSPDILGSTQHGEKLTPEQIKKLSDKLEELVGDGGSGEFTQNQNEKGEVRLYRFTKTNALQGINRYSTRKGFL